MASKSTIPINIDEQLVQCLLCLNQYKNARKLPCGHRYCGDCLVKLINQSSINCPLCKQQFDIPHGGVEGFIEDVYMNEIIEIRKVKTSLNDHRIQKCGSCYMIINLVAYCFECRIALCHTCHEHHLNNLQEHTPHILSVKDVESEDISLGNLMALKDTLRCPKHRTSMSNMCCRTCSNLPVCPDCVPIEHIGHKVETVSTLVITGRKTLQQNRTHLIECKTKIYHLPAKLQLIKQKIIDNIGNTLNQLTGTYDKRYAKLDAKRNLTSKRRESKSVENNENENAEITKKDTEEETEECMDQSKNLDNEPQNRESERQPVSSVDKQNQEESDSFIKRELEVLQKDYQSIISQIETEKEDKLYKIGQISSDMDNHVKTIENVIATVAYILEGCDMAVVQHFDHICSSIEPFLKVMEIDFPSLEKMSSNDERNLLLLDFVQLYGGRLSMYERTININRVKTDGLYINGIACTRNGVIVISGSASNGKAHITVINIRGEILEQRFIVPQSNNSPSPICLCTSFKDFQVAIACYPYEVLLFDVRDCSYVKRNQLPVGQYIRCIATDNVNNHIIIGFWYSRDVYVLDDQLRVIGNFSLPKLLGWPRDLAVSESGILVCDKMGKRVSVVNEKGWLIADLAKPKLKGLTCGEPQSVCTDKYGFIYVQWIMRLCGREQDCALVQYSRDGHHILATRQLNTSPAWIAVAENDEMESVLMATWKSAKMHVFELYDADL